MSKSNKFKNEDFVHLHNHTEYSNFDGLNKINELPMRARQKGFKSIAMTDHGNMAGAIKFLRECSKPAEDENGKEIPTIKPILGCEVYLSKNRHHKSKEDQPDRRKGNRHLIVIAKNWKGYQNLCALTHKSWVEGFYADPRIDMELLSQHREGLIVSSACLSSVINANLLHERYGEAEKTVQAFKSIFGDDFYLEAMYHGIDAEAKIIPEILYLADKYNIKPICSNDAHYAEKSQGASQELLMAMSTSKCLTDCSHIHFPHNEFYLKSASEMGKIFGHRPELLYNTNEVAEKVNSNEILSHLTSGMRLPPYDIPKQFDSAYDYLVHLAWEGMRRLNWDKSQKHIDRLNMELKDVQVAWDNNRYDFATYFLIVRDYMNEAKKRNILMGGGRGSGYGSVLLRTLGIAYGPDPIEYGLLWERFLGFDDARYIIKDDFGLSLKEDNNEKQNVMLDSRIEETMDAEVDPGGVFRY